MLNQIFLVVLLLLLIYVIIQILNPTNKISSMNEGWNEIVVDSSQLKEVSHSSNFTYSLWFYVNDWNDKYNKEKILMDRQGAPKITLGNTQNDINIEIKYFGDSDAVSVPFNCNIKNFPLQKWINLAISVQNQTLDVYIDGKLNKTCILPNLPDINKNSPVKITPQGGFNGWTANFQYWDQSSNPQQIYNIYKQGYGGGALGNIFNKYRIRFQLLKDNNIAGEFQI